MSGARLSGLRFSLPCDRERLNRDLEQWGKVRVTALDDYPIGEHPVCVELWQVSDGRLELGGADQHEWSAAVGAAPYALLARAASRLGGRRLQSFCAARGRDCSEFASLVLGQYHEALVSIPNVLCSDSRTRHNLVLGMLTDSWVARWGDVALGFGYHKRAGSFETDGHSSWRLHDDRGALLSVEVDRRSSHPRLDLSGVDSVWRQPLLGGIGAGRWTASCLQRQLLGADVQAAAVSGVVRLDCGLALGPGSGTYALRTPSAPSRWTAFAFSNVATRVSYPWSVL